MGNVPRSRAYDFDCEGSEPEPSERDALDARIARNPIHARTVVGPEGELRESVVDCHQRVWPLLGECLRCASYEGHAPGDDAFVACRADASPREEPLPPRADRSPEALRTPVHAIMKDPVCVTGDLPVREVERLLGALAIGGVPVVDGGRHPVGMISKSDLVRPGRPGAEASAASAMSTPVHSVRDRATLSEAVSILSSRGVHRLAVVSDAGQLVGIVSTLDVTRWLAAPEPARLAGDFFTRRT